jgi:hypothetical protein
MRSYAMTETPQAASRRIMFALGGVALLLAVGGAVSFVSYARRHAPNPALVAVAPFDIFTGGGTLDRWRVGLAEALTERLNVAPLAAVPQAVVAGTWRSVPQPEIAALELARRTGAAVAIYGRVDPIDVSGASGQRPDSVRVSLVAIDALSSRVVFGVLVRWPAADPAGLAAQLAEHVRHNHPVSRPAL